MYICIGGFMENSNEIFNKLQLQLILSSAEFQKVPPDTKFCINWIEINSEKLRNYWNNLKCKNCSNNCKCETLFKLLQREIHET